MEMEVYDEDDLAYAIDEKCKNIILKGEYIPLDFLDQVVIDFDTVLNLNGNKLFSYFQITNGAQVTIKMVDLQLRATHYRSLRQR